jgi:hypothetical protein
MPYAVKFYAYIFVANVLAFVIVARWVKPFGFVASLGFGLVFAYLRLSPVGGCLERRISSGARGLSFSRVCGSCSPDRVLASASISPSGDLVQIWFLDSAARRSDR